MRGGVLYCLGPIKKIFNISGPLLVRAPIRNYGKLTFHHRGHREHREKYNNQSSVNSVLCGLAIADQNTKSNL
jgi:hypothetical protein